MLAVPLVMRGLNQPLSEIKNLSIAELFFYAEIAAAFSGQNWQQMIGNIDE